MLCPEQAPTCAAADQDRRGRRGLEGYADHGLVHGQGVLEALGVEEGGELGQVTLLLHGLQSLLGIMQGQEYFIHTCRTSTMHNDETVEIYIRVDESAISYTIIQDH